MVAPKYSTTAPLNSLAPPPAGTREYDPEIKDMAQYIHHYKIDSDLAVSFAELMNCAIDLLSNISQA